MALHTDKYLPGRTMRCSAPSPLTTALRTKLYHARMRLTLRGADAAAMLLRGLDSLEVRVRRQTWPRLSAPAGGRSGAQSRYPGIGGLISFDVADGSGARSGPPPR